MNNKKIPLQGIILLAAVVIIAVFSVVSSIAKKPTVTEQDFEFSITYELDGETVTIDDVYKAKYVGNGGYADTKSRNYVGEIGNMGEGNVFFTLKSDENGRIVLHTNFYADYLMGDTEYGYFDNEPFQPQIFYYDSQEIEYADSETLLSHGAKLISYEYPSPIENSFVFSHISYFSGAVVFPTVLIALAALIAILIFVKKEDGLNYGMADKISIVFNFIIGFTLVPFVTVLAVFIDITGGGPELYRQVLYFIPCLSVLCIAASVSLRRKGSGKKSILAEFIGPIVFAIYLIICIIFELL